MSQAFLLTHALWNLTIPVAIITVYLHTRAERYGLPVFYEVLGVLACFARIGFFALLWYSRREIARTEGWCKEPLAGWNVWIASGTHGALAFLGVECVAVSVPHLSFALMTLAGLIAVTMVWSTRKILLSHPQSSAAEHAGVALYFGLTTLVAAAAAWAFSTGALTHLTTKTPIAESWQVLVPFALVLVQLLWALALDCSRYKRMMQAAHG